MASNDGSTVPDTDVDIVLRAYAATPHPREDKIVIVHHVPGRCLDGSADEATVADVFTLRDGHVVKTLAYADPSEALRDV
jgi:ketosteroid isomerase-like protein